MKIYRAYIAVTYDCRSCGIGVSGAEQAAILGCDEDDIPLALRSRAAAAVGRMLTNQWHAYMWDEGGMVGPVGRLP